MKPASFDFRAPAELAGVLDQLAAYGDDARILAGGQSLVPLMNLRMVQPAVLISINKCDDLDTIARKDERLFCGARVRQAAAEENELVRQDCPLLAAALPYVGGQANRNRGTVCGSIAHADPLAELPAVALALDAEMHVASKSGTHRIAAEDFFLGELDTALKPGELLQAVAFKRQLSTERSTFLELGNRRHGFAVAGLALRLEIEDGSCTMARIATMGGGAVAQRISSAEAVLEGAAIDETVIVAAVAALRAATPTSPNPLRPGGREGVNSDRTVSFPSAFRLARAQIILALHQCIFAFFEPCERPFAAQIVEMQDYFAAVVTAERGHNFTEHHRAGSERFTDGLKPGVTALRRLGDGERQRVALSKREG